MKKSILKNVLVKNFLALSTIQIANIILPFITLPYLARVLGVSNYGVVFMVYSVMQLLFVLNDYGFNLSATKEVSNHRLDIRKVNEIFSSIISIKIVLLLITFLLLMLLGIAVPVISEHREAYFLGFGMVVGQTFTPIWLFQGMERMKYITIVNLVSKLTFTILIFVVIDSSEDYIFVPLLYSIGFTIAGFVSIYLAKKEFGVYFSIPKWFQIKEQLNNSTQYFLSRASIAVYTSGNNFIVGIFLGEYYAGIFGVAEKLYTAMIVVYTPLSDAIYPFMVKKRDMELFKKIFVGVILVNLTVITFTYFFSGEIVNIIFGDGYSESAELLKYFCLLAFVIVPTIFIGYPLLGAFGYEKHANYSVVAGSIIHFLVLLIIYPNLTIYLMALLLILTQVIVFLVRMHGVQKLIKLNSLKSNN
nr:oligosaccharide flippase family protein [uncultured Allomuricauda sp.]